MLLHRDVRRGRQGTEDSGIWGPLDTVGPNLLTLTNGSFSPFGASLPAAQEQSLGRTLLTSGLQPMGPLWTRPGTVQPLLRGCRVKEERPGKAPLGGQLLRTRLGRPGAPFSLRAEPPTELRRHLAGWRRERSCGAHGAPDCLGGIPQADQAGAVTVSCCTNASHLR